MPPISTTQSAMSACQGTAGNIHIDAHQERCRVAISRLETPKFAQGEVLLGLCMPGKLVLNLTGNNIVQNVARCVNIFLTTSDFYAQILGSVSSRQQSRRLTPPLPSRG